MTKNDAPLNGAAIRELRALGHHLEPVVMIGKDGVTDGVVASLRAALLAHELVKVRVQTEAPVDRHEAGEELATKTGAWLAQVLGRTLLLYKRHPKRPRLLVEGADVARTSAARKQREGSRPGPALPPRRAKSDAG
jgi:RNA-binding protein